MDKNTDIENLEDIENIENLNDIEDEDINQGITPAFNSNQLGQMNLPNFQRNPNINSKINNPILNRNNNNSSIPNRLNNPINGNTSRNNQTLNKKNPNGKNNNLGKKNNNLPNAKAPKKEVPKALNKKEIIKTVAKNYINSKKGNNDKDTKDNKTENTKDDFTLGDSLKNTMNSASEKLSGKVSTFKKILPLLLMAGGLLISFMFLIVIIISPIAAVQSFFSYLFSSEENSHVYTENEEKLLKQELKYNEKLEEIVNEYNEKYNVSIDKNLLHAVLIYRYYVDDNKLEEDDLEDIDEEDDEVLSGEIDYKTARKNIKKVAKLMIIDYGDDTYGTDNYEDGKVYNQILESNFLDKYYKNYLANTEIETKKELLSEIYYFYEYVMELLETYSGNAFLSDSIPVYIQTCDVPYTYATNDQGKRVYNNKNVNQGTDYPQYLSMTDYLKGVVLGEIGTKYMTEEYREGVKAFVIAATTFIIGDSKSGYYPGATSLSFPSGNCRQLTCDPNFGCSYDKSGKYSTTFTGVRYDTQRPGWKNPLTDAQQEFMNGVLEEVFGEIMVDKGITPSTFSGSEDVASGSYLNTVASCKSNHCLGQVEAMQDAKNGMTYTAILDKYYDSNVYDIINIQEGLYYSNSTNFNGQITLNESFHFYQGNYANTTFCGRSNATIKSSGCGVTSAAIAVSLLTGVSHDPVEMMNLAYSNKKCGAGISGTNNGFFRIAASKYGLGFYQLSKSTASDADITKMLSDLANGNTVIVARMAPNSGRYKTSSGHYITLVGVKNEGGTTRVLVWDPATKTNSNRDNYWADFNEDILKYVNNPSFFVFSRR